ncbi:hypothetical protein SDC9_161143 [bioreactor metagenome]|uniref:Uncharacterized protein n=1 Tax=bioreactor metagenome TaxID=1076179 RepID=A0A645FHJ6_9ZZZZ
MLTDGAGVYDDQVGLFLCIDFGITNLLSHAENFFTIGLVLLTAVGFNIYAWHLYYLLSLFTFFIFLF